MVPPSLKCVNARLAAFLCQEHRSTDGGAGFSIDPQWSQSGQVNIHWLRTYDLANHLLFFSLCHYCNQWFASWLLPQKHTQRIIRCWLYPFAGFRMNGVLLIANNPAMWSPPTVDSDRNGCVCPPTPPKKKAVQKINFQMCFILISSYIIYQIVFYW